MRLTLRTLLAYIDDTLDPEQTRQLGARVAESEEAKQIIERIKKLTRKRSLSTPPITDGDGPADDPNTVAEYLDNELDTELLKEIEEIALDPESHANSDLVLAELAACHQILTLVMGEPARVPPSAKQRMYRLVKGRESIPYRKPAANPSIGQIDPEVQSHEVFDSDEAYLMALPIYRRSSSWQRRLAPIGALLLLVGGIAFSIRMVLPTNVASQSIAFEPPVVAERPTKKADDTVAPPKPEPKTEVVPMPKVEPMPEPKVEPMPEPKVEPKRPLIPPPDQPNPRREIVGKFQSVDTVLLTRENPTAAWKRVLLLSPEIASRDQLVSLPGYRSEVQLDSGVKVVLWGNLPEFLDMPLLETRLTFHAPQPGIDADFTLDAGRVFLSTKRANKPSIVRLRFKSEIWDITLPNDQTEVILDMFGRYVPGVPFSPKPGGEGPQFEMYAGVLKGQASFRVGNQEFESVTAPAVLIWDNKGDGKVEPEKLGGIPPQWSKQTPTEPRELRNLIRETEEGLLDFSKRLSKKDADVEIVLAESLSDDMEKPSRRILAVMALEALDAMPTLADALNDSTHHEARAAAILALRHWIGGAAERDLLFHRLLIEKKNYSERQADFVLSLLHSFSREEIGDPSTYSALIELLNHDKIAVRELAWWHLSRLDSEGAREAKLGFNAAMPEDMRTAIVAGWKKRIPDGKLPPRPMPAKN